MAKKANPIIEALRSAQSQTVAKDTVVIRPAVTFFSPGEWEKVVLAIAEAYPDLILDATQVTNSGLGKNGMPIKLAYFSARSDKAKNMPARNVTLFSSGKVVWTNLEPVA